jgi:hypothetical protein
MRSDADRLSDILAAIAKIKERVADRLASERRNAPGLGYTPSTDHWRGCPWRLPAVQGMLSRDPMAADYCIAEYTRARILRPQLGPDLDDDPKGSFRAGGAGSKHPRWNRGRSPLRRMSLARSHAFSLPSIGCFPVVFPAGKRSTEGTGARAFRLGIIV